MDRESALYAPVKALLEERGYTVKGEVGPADLVAVRGADEPPVIVELKLRLTLSLIHQAVDRLTLTDHVYIAVPRPTGRTARQAMRDTLRLCRRLGIGFITLRADGRLEVHCDPGPYAPRQNKAKAGRLLQQFHRLRGDPNEGGATRHGLVTAYRQDAVLCAQHLAQHGDSRGQDVAKATGIAHATRLMRDNHYGWFQKVATGVYGLSEAGRQGLADWADCAPEPKPAPLAEAATRA